MIAQQACSVGVDLLLVSKIEVGLDLNGLVLRCGD